MVRSIGAVVVTGVVIREIGIAGPRERVESREADQCERNDKSQGAEQPSHLFFPFIDAFAAFWKLLACSAAASGRRTMALLSSALQLEQSPY
jgi:hypothetical protein